jgi:hypothetical protein
VLYKRLTKGLNDRGQLIPSDANVYDYITDDVDYYISTYLYTEEHKKQFQENGTVAGITDVTTNKLWWDFDSEHEPEAAREDATQLVRRLIDKKNIDHRDILIAFSGNKGFGIELNLTTSLTPKDTKAAAFELAHDLKTFDVKMYNASRILRVIATRHQKTGLYKTPLTPSQLKELSVDDIMALAKNEPGEASEFRWAPVDLDIKVVSKERSAKATDHLPEMLDHLDYSMKPKFLTNCRWAIQNGHFKEGDRSTALLCLGSTYKNMGFDLEHVYRLLKGTAELQARRHHCERFPDEEVYNNIVMQVFGPHWNNGQYTCRDEGNWLHEYCSDLEHPCNHKAEDELKPRTFISLAPDFKDYVLNIDKNTVKTGLHTLDKNVFLSTGANVGIIAPPGAGKTSIAFEILENTSVAGVHSVFAGLDMAKNRTFEKLLYRETGLDREELYKIFQDGREGAIIDNIQHKYKNVHFFKKSAPTPADLKQYIKEVQDKTGEKVKLVISDYFERFNSNIGDDTAASKAVAGELQDLVDDENLCKITLYQPNKAALFGGPDQPIYDYTKIKGSSFVYQSLRIILSMWRPFYNPKDFQNDKYLQMAILKNDLGELGTFAFNWDGKRGRVTDMDQFQFEEFERALKAKENAKETDKEGLNF